MKNKILIYGRYAVAAVVLALCCLAFETKFYSLKIFDAQFTPALQSGLLYGFGVSLALFAALIVLTLLFGRIYCSTLCPLGLYQELLTILFKPFYKKRKPSVQKNYGFGYFAAAVLFGMLAGGSVILLRRLDPYSLAGNAASGAVFGLGFAAALAVLVFFKKRFFCTNICPVGAVLGFLSRFSPFKIRIDPDKCKSCSLCARECPCQAIDFKNHTVNNETCVKCFKCLNKCNFGSIYYGLPKAKNPGFNPSRRQFFAAAVLLIAFGKAYRCGADFGRKAAEKIKRVILPAGAGDAEDFASRCLNCNLCVQNCPMKIIKKANAEVPVVHIDYGDAFCRFDCHKCSEVCPSGALKHLTLAEKQNTKIATAAVDEDFCIKCGLCAQSCPRQIIIKEEGEFPVVQFDKCIGCGKCASVCPVKAISMETVKEQLDLD